MYFSKKSTLGTTTLLASGAAISQIIVIVAAPLLTRFYSPQEFGILAIYVSIVNSLGLVLAGRYDQAIYIAKDEREIYGLTYLSVILALLSAVSLTAISGFLISYFFSSFLETYKVYWPVFLLGIFTYSVYQTLISKNVKTKNAFSISKSRTIQSIGIVLIQILMVTFKFSVSGLIIGQVLGQITGLPTILKSRYNYKSINLIYLRELAVKYRSFPYYNVWSSLLNSSSITLLPIIISNTHGIGAAGYYALSQRVIGLPMGVIGIAISQSYALELGNAQSYVAVYGLFKSTLRNTSILGLIVMLISICSYFLSYFVWRVVARSWEIYCYSFLCFFYASTCVPYIANC
ncbi:hypothetical protein DKM44_11250 [Deinococcus irradiatisoli]|uniref:Polysaccharide biosynthesis protein n=1 Tax=Deinococcus irradiatisoli TaxID=2202254 RepID=A0A2Z3JSQ6_9DEIO|nr:oligosaccharide flippase family protein [Deinococcus irradiatisoli]AWN23734.1 hypothetical protein DKM44_11250 [Deinococcus irradiatisoli]